MLDTPMMRLEWESPPAPTGGSEALARFSASIREEHLGYVTLRASYSILGALTAALGTDEAVELRQLSAAYAITRIEHDPVVREQLADTNTAETTIELDASAVEDLARGYAEKQCDRQVRDGRDLWCDAAGDSDETASVTIGSRTAAPTSRPICGECDVPDSRLRCSAFMHPAVTGTRTFGGGHTRRMAWALCDVGHQDLVTSTPQLCIPETIHQCWHALIPLGPNTPAVLLDPLALPDTLDRLDDVWRASHNGAHVLALRSGLDAAGLAMHAGTREAFADRLRACSEILGNLTIDDEFIPSDTPNEYRRQSLSRLESVLRGGSDSERSALVEDAVDTLRRIKKLDNAMQHSTGQLAVLFASFGLSYPPADWQHAWEVIRAALVDALRRIIRMIRDIGGGTAADERDAERS